MEKKKLRVEIIGYEDQLNTIAHFLRQVESCGEIGHSTTLHLWVDGDGAARINVNFPEILNDEYKPKPRNWDNEPKEGFKFCID